MSRKKVYVSARDVLYDAGDSLVSGARPFLEQLSSEYKVWIVLESNGEEPPSHIRNKWREWFKQDNLLSFVDGWIVLPGPIAAFIGKSSVHSDPARTVTCLDADPYGRVLQTLRDIEEGI